MQAEAAGGFGDVALALGEDTLDVFPLQAFQRRRCVGKVVDTIHLGPGMAEQGLGDLVGIDRLGQVIVRTALDRFDGGGDRGVTGEQQDAHAGSGCIEARDQGKPALAAEFEIEDDVARLHLDAACQCFGSILCRGHLESACGERASEDMEKNLIVVDEQYTIGGFNVHEVDCPALAVADANIAACRRPRQPPR